MTKEQVDTAKGFRLCKAFYEAKGYTVKLVASESTSQAKFFVLFRKDGTRRCAGVSGEHQTENMAWGDVPCISDNLQMAINEAAAYCRAAAFDMTIGIYSDGLSDCHFYKTIDKTKSSVHAKLVERGDGVTPAEAITRCLLKAMLDEASA